MALFLMQSGGALKTQTVRKQFTTVKGGAVSVDYVFDQLKEVLGMTGVVGYDNDNNWGSVAPQFKISGNKITLTLTWAAAGPFNKDIAISAIGR